MTQTFELIEVQTSALRDAYEPTMLHLQELLPKAEEHVKSIRAYGAKIRASALEEWHKQAEKHYAYEEDEYKYRCNIDNIWNRLLRRKFIPPKYCPHPGSFLLSDWYTKSWYMQYDTKNLVVNLLEECNNSLLPCTYSDKVKMTAEQLQRVEYFRRGRALKDALAWLDKKPEQF